MEPAMMVSPINILSCNAIGKSHLFLSLLSKCMRTKLDCNKKVRNKRKGRGPRKMRGKGIR